MHCSTRAWRLSRATLILAPSVARCFTLQKRGCKSLMLAQLCGSVRDKAIVAPVARMCFRLKLSWNVCFPDASIGSGTAAFGHFAPILAGPDA